MSENCFSSVSNVWIKVNDDKVRFYYLDSGEQSLLEIPEIELLYCMALSPEERTLFLYAQKRYDGIHEPDGQHTFYRVEIPSVALALSARFNVLERSFIFDFHELDDMIGYSSTSIWGSVYGHVFCFNLVTGQKCKMCTFPNHN